MMTGVDALRREDPQLYSLLQREMTRQSDTLSLVASCGGTVPSVLAASSATIVNVTAEGYPGNRYHAGCEFVDQVETLAIERAKRAYGASYANVQPHCASSANHIVMHALLSPGDKVLGMALEEGGHLTHGAAANASGKLYDVRRYGLNAEGLIDFGQVRELALDHRPKLIVCGATSYTRSIDFSRFRSIADEVGAFVLADITHIAGLVAAALHPSPIHAAHFTTLCTFKQLYGPRGGLILMGRDHDTLAPNGTTTLSGLIQKSVFPGLQGSPATSQIAAKARAFDLVKGTEFLHRMQRIIENASALADGMAARGYHVCGGGTDNHIVLVKLPDPLTGVIAQDALERCGIIVNKNKVPGDPRSSQVASGIRLGSNTVALRHMGRPEMATCVDLIHEALSAVVVLGEREYALDNAIADKVRSRVRNLCRQFALPYDFVDPAHDERAEPAFAG